MLVSVEGRYFLSTLFSPYDYEPQGMAVILPICFRFSFLLSI